ncbi:MAG: RNA polymerase subunit sigma-24, partial [Cellulomonadaceae bacterium]|nr:RNA polymerase subunit sigma-24 [Cellulomonadaceae bacterium]
QQVTLCTEAIRLARALGDLLPDEPEVHGLLALMLLHDSRRTARTSADGDLVPLDEQDRGRWDRVQIADGVRALGRARAASGGAGPYVLQAEIAACHATASAPAATDWDRIVALYDRLVEVVPSPHVRLGRAVAIGMARGADAGLDALAELHDAGAPHHLAAHLLAAAEADLLRRAGRGASATEAYRRALGLAPTEAERRFLERRLAELSDAHRLPDA